MIRITDQYGTNYLIATDNKEIASCMDNEPTIVLNNDGETVWNWIVRSEKEGLVVSTEKPYRDKYENWCVPIDAGVKYIVVTEKEVINDEPLIEESEEPSDEALDSENRKWITVEELISMLNEIEHKDTPVLINGKNLVEVSFMEEKNMSLSGSNHTRKVHLKSED